MTLRELYLATKAFLATPDRWSQCASRNAKRTELNPEGEPVKPDDPEAVRWCLRHAMYLVAKKDGGPGWSKLYDRSGDHLLSLLGINPVVWNDAFVRTFEEVHDLLDAAAADPEAAT